MIKNKFNFGILISFIIFENAVMSGASAMNDRLEGEIEARSMQGGRGRGNPVPLPYGEVTRQQHGGTPNPTLSYQIQGQSLLNQQQTGQGIGRAPLPYEPSTPWDEGDPLFQQFDYGPVDVKKEYRDYQRGIDQNTWKGDDPSSSDEEN